MKAFRLIVLPAILLPALFVDGCSRAPAANAVAEVPAFTVSHGLVHLPAESPLRREIRVDAVTASGGATTAMYPAIIEGDPARSSTIVSPAIGRVVALDVGLGDHVHKGQVLARILSGDGAQAYADNARASDASDLARRQLDRAIAVQGAGGNASKDVEAARSALAQAEAEQARSRIRLAALQGGGGAPSRSHELVLTAPFDGSITSLSIAAGSTVNDVTAPLMTVTNLDRVWATANVPEDAAAMVSVGDAARISLSAYPGMQRVGSVGSISAVLDNDTRRIKARISLDNPDERLKPNMFATVSLQQAGAPGVVVPQTALIMDNDRVSVFVERGPWTFERRDIDIGSDNGSVTQVLHGLAVNERVVVRGGVLLQ
ncbi:MAG TPA: efflux RND transporter periplasmic adaptor subunit [Luteibacter sp.]|uniref:efflux RND transporter periplasmic adaptor subunit n=1 Tax=Luteibacter sp. TaxID=1886636 RepID=UPI002CC0611B|nr:efflux RND transporter periplasmic adaptor subunit [Luteibacter sp.]HVI54740.1 efflux RND transporter periplasmic adaptor subunit [Luteibacter sp.]